MDMGWLLVDMAGVEAVSVQSVPLESMSVPSRIRFSGGFLRFFVVFLLFSCGVAGSWAM